MRQEVQTLFKQHFGCAPTHVVRVPGYVELLGVPGLCDDGLAVTDAIDRYVCLASTPRSDGKIELVSSASPARETFWAGQMNSNPAAPWADGFKRALEQLRRRGVNATGFSAAIWDDPPSRADFGRSTALEVAAVLGLRQLCPFSLTESGLAPPPKRNAKGELPPLTSKEKIHFARLLHPSRDGIIRAAPGWLGVASSLLGKAWHVLNVDLRFGTLEAAPMIGEVLVVCEPENATKAETVDGASGEDEIRRDCGSAAAKLGAKSLRSVELNLLKAGRSKLTPREYECARHAVGEMTRVVAAERALRDEDHRQFGQFMFQSHQSARDLLKNVPPEADLLVELAHAHSGCLGARRCAGNPTQATVNLVPHHQAEIFMKHMVHEYEDQTGHKLRTFVLQTVDGAG